MKRVISVILLLMMPLCLAACATAAPVAAPSPSPDTTASPDQIAAFNAAMDDWLLGTNYGIESYTYSAANHSVHIVYSAEAYAKLSEQDKNNVSLAIMELLSTMFGPLVDANGSCLTYSINTLATTAPETSASPVPSPTANATSPEASGPVNLIFIHHSCGGNWLNDGLCAALNSADFHVADITYGWREYGDRTDTGDWPTWFTDGVMPLVYNELNAMSAANAIDAAPGENTVVMFKSCYPNSDVGGSIDDEKAIYMSLLPYFEKHPDKMFVLVTPPPMVSISNPTRTRELCKWLQDRASGWLKSHKTKNVFVFDFYNVLTHPDAHHRMVNGQEEWNRVEGYDVLYYPTGDDHPSAEGNRKAAEEFIGLLEYWYGQFQGQ